MSEYSSVSIGNIKNPNLIEIDFGRNSLPQEFLSKIFFQQKHFKKIKDKTEDGVIYNNYFYMRPISEILVCLELIGSNLGKIRLKYQKALDLYKEELSLYKPEYDVSNNYFYSSYYEECIYDKKDNIQLDTNIFFEEIQSIYMKKFNNFDSYKEAQTNSEFRDMNNNYSGFGLFFHKEMLLKHGKKLGKFHLIFLNTLIPFDFVRLLLVNDYILNQHLVLDYTNLVPGYGYPESPLEDDEIKDINNSENFLIITEGSSDTDIIKASMDILRPHCSIFFDYINMKEDYPFTGTGNLFNFTKGLIKIGVSKKILIIFDNDTEGLYQYNKLKRLQFPNNIIVRILPDLEDMKHMNTVGTSGQRKQDINGKACSIECFLDLSYKTAEKPIIRWTNYNKDLNQYQGALMNKQDYIKKFQSHRNKFLGEGKEKYNTKKLEYLLDYIIKECSILASEIQNPLDNRILPPS